MTWLRQAAHVAAKDLRHASWMLAVYAVIVAVATAVAVHAWGSGRGGVLLATLLVPFGLVVFAVVVQVDAPMGSDVFWATRPLYPSAVFAAKVAVAAVALVGVGVAGQAVALSALGVESGSLPAHIARSVADYGAWLGVAGVVAGFARNIRTFVLSMIIVALAPYVGLWSLLPWLVWGPMVVRTPPTLEAGIAVALFGLVAYQYHTRDVRRSAVAAAMVVVAAMAAVGVAGRQPVPLPITMKDVPAGLRADLRVDSVAFEPLPRGEQELRLTLGVAGGASDLAYVLVNPRLEIREAGKPSERLDEVAGSVWLRTVDPLADDGFRRVGPRVPWLERDRTLRFRLSSSQMGRLSRGATLVLTGRIEVLEARQLQPQPLEIGRSFADDGVRIRIDSVEGSPEEPVIRVVQASVAPPGTAGSWVLHHNVSRFDVALADPGRREAVPLAGMATTFAAHAVVLPGVSVALEERRLQPMSSVPWTDLGDAGAESHRGTELRVVHWKPRGGFDVRSELRVRPGNG